MDVEQVKTEFSVSAVGDGHFLISPNVSMQVRVIRKATSLAWRTFLSSVGASTKHVDGCVWGVQFSKLTVQPIGPDDQDSPDIPFSVICRIDEHIETRMDELYESDMEKWTDEVESFYSMWSEAIVYSWHTKVVQQALERALNEKRFSVYSYRDASPPLLDLREATHLCGDELSSKRLGHRISRKRARKRRASKNA